MTLSSCVDKVICPAFQSTYILDDSSRMAYYSPLWKIDKEERLKYLAEQKAKTQSYDSAGPIVASVGKGNDYFAHVEPYVVTTKEVKKTKYGIVKYEPYWLKKYNMRTAPMENLLAPDPIKVPEPIDYGEFIVSDFTDSVSDSTAIAMVDIPSDTFEIPKLAVVEPPKPKNEIKYLYRYDPEDEMLNVEQAYYNKYFGNQLYAYVPIKEKPAPSASVNNANEEAKGGFFKNIFSGNKINKQQNLVDEPTGDIPVEEPTPLNEEPPAEEPTVDEETVDDGF
ncbi:MAG: hypothetical protein JXR10_09105 [Cyclobacteriaceae bacterium]